MGTTRYLALIFQHSELKLTYILTQYLGLHLESAGLDITA